MARKRIEEIDSQLAARNTNIDDIRRKYPHWKQPDAPAAAPAQSAPDQTVSIKDIREAYPYLKDKTDDQIINAYKKNGITIAR